MYSDISYFLLDVRANQSGRAWVPWSIDSLWKIQHIRVLYMYKYHLIRIYLLFSYGCSSEPTRPRVSSLEYRFLWKYTIFVYFTSNFISCTQISLIFFWMFGANQSGRAWVPWSIDSFEKYSTFVYFTCIISSHIRNITVIFLWMFGRTYPDRAWDPWSIDSFENTLSSCTFTSNIISCTQISHIFFWMFGRTSPVVHEFLGV